MYQKRLRIFFNKFKRIAWVNLTNPEKLVSLWMELKIYWKSMCTFLKYIICYTNILMFAIKIAFFWHIFRLKYEKAASTVF